MTQLNPLIRIFPLHNNSLGIDIGTTGILRNSVQFAHVSVQTPQSLKIAIKRHFTNSQKCGTYVVI